MRPELPVILTSGSEDTKRTDVMFLRKPFALEEALELVGQSLKKEAAHPCGTPQERKGGTAGGQQV